VRRTRPNQQSALGDQKSSGFTLIELLVVVAIIAVLVAILLPAFARVRYQTYVLTCSSGLRQIGLGVTYYAQDEKDFLPASRSHWSGKPWYWPRLGIDAVAEGMGTLNDHWSWFGPDAEKRYPKVFMCPFAYNLGHRLRGGTISGVEMVYTRYTLATNGSHYKNYPNLWNVEPPEKITQTESIYHPDKPFSRKIIADACMLDSDPWFDGWFWNTSHFFAYPPPLVPDPGSAPGVNSLFLDGHVEFVPGGKMTKFLNVGPGGLWY